MMAQQEVKDSSPPPTGGPTKPEDSRLGGEPKLVTRLPRRNHETIYGEIYDPVTDLEPLPPAPPKTDEQMNGLLEKVKKTAFLKEIDEPRLRAALSHMALSRTTRDEIIYEQGSLGQWFFIVEEGSFKIVRREDGQLGPDNVVGKFDPEEKPCFGELALLYDEVRPYTVISEGVGKLWKINRKLYTRIVVKMAYKKRQRHMRFMNNCPLLNSVAQHEKVRLSDAFETKKFKKDDVIIKEGDEADGMYWIVEGRVQVKKNDDENPKVLGKKKFFGEMALLLKQPRNATCTALTDCELVFLQTETFERLMGKLHNIMLRNRERYKQVLKEALGTEDTDSDRIR